MQLPARQRRIIDPIWETDIPPFPVRKFTVAEYHQLLKIGILQSGDPYELLRGWIVPKSTPSRRHVSVRSHILRRLTTSLANTGWRCATRETITLRDSELEPALFVCPNSGMASEKGRSHWSDVALVTEIADETLGRVREIRCTGYAAGRIPVCWIINLDAGRIEVGTGPRSRRQPMYHQWTYYDSGDSVPVVIGGKELGRIAVKELLP